MQNLQPDAARFELPRVLIYSAALTCGMLAALAVQIWLVRAGYDPAAVLSTRSLQLRAAGPWWAIAGAAFIASGIAGACLNRWGSRLVPFRILRWSFAAVAVFGLAHIGHSAAGQTVGNAGAHVAASLAALAIAALLGLLGAYLTVRR